MTYSYFPVENTMLDNVVSYQDFNRKFPDGVEKSFELAPGVKVTLKLTNHPVYCVAYRIEADGKSFIFTGDHEPWEKTEDKDRPGDTRELFRIMNHRLTEFCRGVDLIAIDTTYTQAEYESKGNPALTKRGWGHSFFEFNIGLAKQAGVKRMAFTHHDPTRTDDALDRLMKDNYLPQAAREAPNTEFFAAREGMEIAL
jgi:ribonuclease BN (tRNA processing enzyme)